MYCTLYNLKVTFILVIIMKSTGYLDLIWIHIHSLFWVCLALETRQLLVNPLLLLWVPLCHIHPQNAVFGEVSAHTASSARSWQCLWSVWRIWSCSTPSPEQLLTGWLTARALSCACAVLTAATRGRARASWTHYDLWTLWFLNTGLFLWQLRFSYCVRIIVTHMYYYPYIYIF